MNEYKMKEDCLKALNNAIHKRKCHNCSPAILANAKALERAAEIVSNASSLKVAAAKIREEINARAGSQSSTTLAEIQGFNYAETAVKYVLGEPQ